ncbi:LytR/AlgR family response regulator transcription factor [Winogradskyella sp.]|uniref:LytR/AlgR family response regulator transcription factor n=1 Tax=Winogradskyella sp. TaxID=1883156 RepID=UPI003BA92A58
MIKAIIVEDEIYLRDCIRAYITDQFANDVMIVGEAESVKKSLDLIHRIKPDLIFLDIHLSDGTGFDILTRTTHKAFDVIFITGFDHHAIKAIKVGALDYILKPIDDEELSHAVSKAIMRHKDLGNIEKLIEVSNDYFNGALKKRVILKTADFVHAVYEEDIIYCKSAGNYTTIHTTTEERIMVSKSIKKIQEILTEIEFIRCHQSYVVNRRHVLKYHKKGMLIMSSDIKIPVSARRKDTAIRQIFKS